MSNVFGMWRSSRASLDSRPRQKCKRSRNARERTLAFESLEGRAMLSLTIGWDATHGALSVSGASTDSIVITDQTSVKVNGQDVGNGVLAADV